MRKISVLFSLFIIAIFISCSGEINPDLYKKSEVAYFDGAFTEQGITVLKSNPWATDWDASNPDRLSVDASITDEGLVLKGVEGVNYIGGGFTPADSTRTIDLSEVVSFEFDIKGTIPAEALSIYMRAMGAHYLDKPLSEYGVSITENEFTHVTIPVYDEDFPVLCRTYVNDVFTYASSAEKGFTSDQYVVIKNITYLDANGNSVKLEYTEETSSGGSWDDVFEKNYVPSKELQSWSDTCMLQLTETGLKIIATGNGWFGGAIVPADLSTYYDISSLDSIKLKIRGNMKAGEVSLGFNCYNCSVQYVLSSVDPAKELNENDFTEYTLKIPALKEMQKIMCAQLLTWSQGSSYAGIGKWIEITDITPLDSAGNPIVIKAYAKETLEGDYAAVFGDESTMPVDPPQFMSWSNTCLADLDSNKGMRIIPSSNSSWFGGGFYRNNNTNYDISKVDSVSFEISGDIPLEAISVNLVAEYKHEIGIFEGVDIAKGTIAEHAERQSEGVYSKDSYLKVTIELPKDKDGKPYENASYIFAFSQGTSAEWMGGYFWLRNIRFLDENGNCLQIKHV